MTRSKPYDPRLLGGAAVVPFIGQWSGESRYATTIVRHHTDGIGFLDETIADRDEWHVLWTRHTHAIGVGRPLFTAVHPARQRHAMRRLLCQVCARPADHGAAGTLFLLPACEVAEAGGLARGMTTGHPPVCRDCALISVCMCPGLRANVVAVRARSRLSGVLGTVYRPCGRFGLAPPDPCPVVVGFDDPALPWTLASRAVRTFTDVTLVELPERRR